VVLVAGVLAAVLIQRQLSTPKSVAAGEAGEEDGLSFEVSSVDCDISEVGFASGVSLQAENGTFCIVKPRVENLGEERRSLEARCQYLIDGSGQRYTPREDAAQLRELTEFLFDPKRGLGPFEHTPVFVALYYDVATNTEPAAIEFHASCDSRGVRIPVPA
jgi:hypothetical protein